MKTVEELTENIIRLTAQIETNYPELYKFLDENPIPINHNQPIEEDLEKYLDTLKQELRHHILTHPAVNN